MMDVEAPTPAEERSIVAYLREHAMRGHMKRMRGQGGSDGEAERIFRYLQRAASEGRSVT